MRMIYASSFARADCRIAVSACALSAIAPAGLPARACPGKQPLQQVLESVQGPVAKIIAVIIIIVTGLTLAFGETAGRLSPADPDRLRPVDRLRRIELLLLLLQLRRRGADRMTSRHIAGFEAPRASLAGRADPARRRAPRARHRQRHARGRAWVSVCSYGSQGFCLWAIGHAAAVWAAKRDPAFVDVVRRHLRIPGHLSI